MQESILGNLGAIMLELALEGMTVGESTGHVVYDFGIFAVVLLIVVFKGIEVARSFGLIPDKLDREGNSSDFDRPKPVGRLHVDGLRTIIRHETRDLLNPLTLLIGKYHDKQLEELQEINQGIQKLVVIMEERGRHHV